MSDLLSVDEALRRILGNITCLPVDSVSLKNALNRVLAEDIIATVNIPAFANSSMDGFAVRATDVSAATNTTPVELKVVTDIPAGTYSPITIKVGEAARIMTGAPLPKGADAVIPVESTDATWSSGDHSALSKTVTVMRSVNCGDYVRPVGEDIKYGQVVLQAGSIVGPAEIGVLASLGCVNVAVIRQPRVAILSTGDELVDVGDPLGPGQIRDSNSYALAALVESCHGIPIRIETAHDKLEDVRQKFHDALAQHPDIILSSAGVSVGAFDVVRTVIDELGSVNFWRINLRPGKPMAFGALRDIPFFGLPGNPVSAMVTFEVFVRPTLLKMANRPDNARIITATLGDDMSSDGRRSYVRVKLNSTNGKLVAHTTGTQSSGALMSMVLADGLMIIPEEVKFLQAGTEVSVRLLRDIPQ